MDIVTSSQQVKKGFRAFGNAVAAFVLLGMLASCSVFEPRIENLNTRQHNWEMIKQKIQQQTNWHLIGKIGVRTPDDSLTAAINNWTQKDGYFDIDLSSTFFGLGASRLTGTSNFLTLLESGEEPLSSDQPNELIEAVLGFSLPISHLVYWVKGLPAPDQAFEVKLNQQGLPETLTQHHWQLQFSKYHLEQGIPLPGKIKLQRADTRITLAIIKWTLL